MLVLLLCVILAEWFQPGIITQAPASLFAQTDRTYKAAPMNFYGQMLIMLFRIGTLGLAVYVCVYAGKPFTFTGYLVICGIVLAMLLVKMLCNMLIDYTFMLTRQVASPHEHYANIVTIAVLVLYAALLVLLRVGSIEAMRWALGIITILFIAMWFYRSWRMFVQSPKAILYLVLYIGTLEVLPLAALYYLSDKTISIL